MSGFSDEEHASQMVRKFVAVELRPGVMLPGDDEDLVESGLIDSMGWNSVRPRRRHRDSEFW